MTDRTWKTALVVLAAVATGVLISNSGILPRAQGIAEGQSGGVICLIGEQFSQDAPIILVSVPDQTVLIYNYNYSNRDIRLSSARTFKFDKLLTDWQTKGPTVEEVRNFINR